MNRVGKSMKCVSSPVAKKKAASNVKKPVSNVYSKLKKGSSKDKRANAIWLWLAVSVGKGVQKYTHANGMKKVAFRLLPKRSESENGQPRGFMEIKETIKVKVRKGSFLVFDKWLATVKAIKDLGFKHAPPVNHTIGWRDAATGFHSNDIESENARLKGWSRKLYGHLILTELDLFEYQWSVNTGGGFSNAMKALSFSNGVQFSGRALKA